jgi:hypothetical protein
MGMTVLFADVQEMLLLCLTCIIFVIGILRRELEVASKYTCSQSNVPEEES